MADSPSAPLGDDLDEERETSFILVLVAAAVGVPAVIISLILVGRLLSWSVAPAQEGGSWVTDRLGRSRQVLAFGRKHSSNLRTRLYGWLYLGEDARWGFRWDLLQSLLATVSCCGYVIDTYAAADECSLLPQFYVLTVESVCSFFFAADYALRLFLAKQRVRWVLSPMALVEMFTILPMLLVVIMNAIDEEASSVPLNGSASIELWSQAHLNDECSNSANFSFFRFLRLARIMRIMRVGRFMRNQQSDSFWHHVSTLLTSVVMIILVAACTFQWAETITGETHLPFHEALYYMIIEVLGRPRLPVTTTQGYLICTVVVVVVVVIVPWRLVLLAEALKKQSRYTREVFTPRPHGAHVIVAGHTTVASISEFTSDFFHQDMGDHDTHVVILSPEEPSARMRALLSHPHRVNRMTYLQGTIDHPLDLDRCRADVAQAVFLLADKMPMRETAEHHHDLRTIAQVLALKSYNEHLQLFVQLLRYENKAFMAAMPDWRSVGTAEHPRADQVICITELATSLLALSAVAPGASTLCTNLYSTQQPPPKGAIVEPWMQEYNAGASHEIYLCALEPAFLGWSVADVAIHLYEVFGATLIALEGVGGSLLFCPLPPHVKIEPTHAVGQIITKSAVTAAAITQYVRSDAVLPGPTAAPSATSTSMAPSAAFPGAKKPPKWGRATRCLRVGRRFGLGRGKSPSSAPESARPSLSIELPSTRSSDAMANEAGDVDLHLLIVGDDWDEVEEGAPDAKLANDASASRQEGGHEGVQKGGKAMDGAVAVEEGLDATTSGEVATTAEAATVANVGSTGLATASTKRAAAAVATEGGIDQAKRAQIARSVQRIAMEFALEGMPPSELLEQVEGAISSAVGKAAAAVRRTSASTSSGIGSAAGPMERAASLLPAATSARPSLSLAAAVRMSQDKKAGQRRTSISAGASLEAVLWDRLVSRQTRAHWRPVKGHVLLCGGVVHMGLCARCLVEHWPTVRITALCNVPVRGGSSISEWLERAGNLLACPSSRVTIVQGSDLSDADLAYAGAPIASSVLIFSPAALIAEERRIADVATVLTAMRVQRVAPGVFSCVDLHEASNARFFRLALKDHDHDDDTHEHHATSPGLVPWSPVVSTLLTPARTGAKSRWRIRAPSLGGVPSKPKLRRSATSNSLDQTVLVGAVATTVESRMIAGGRSFSTVVLDRLLCRAYFNNHVVRVLEMISTPPRVSLEAQQHQQHHSHASATSDEAQQHDTDQSQHSQNVLRLRRVPTALKGSTYGKLYRELLLQRQQLTLGLFRRRRDKHDQLVEYVLTNPPRDTKLLDSDRVYVLGPAS